MRSFKGVRSGVVLQALLLASFAALSVLWWWGPGERQVMVVALGRQGAGKKLRDDPPPPPPPPPPPVRSIQDKSGSVSDARVGAIPAANSRHRHDGDFDTVTDEEELKKLAKSMLLPPPASDVEYNLSKKAPAFPYVSQFGQDRVADQILRNLTNGFFVECGASNGELYSNSLYLELARGWTGLLVEANPASFAKLVSKHRRAHLLNGCLSIHPYASREKYLLPRNGDLSGLMNISEPGKWLKRNRGRRLEFTQVQCIPLYPVLSVLEVKTVHFFSLDVEGAEVEVLQALPWDKLDIWVMTIEMIHAHGGPNGARMISQFMKSKGYEEVAHVRIDSIFARKDKIEDGTLHIVDRGQPLPELVFMT